MPPDASILVPLLKSDVYRILRSALPTKTSAMHAMDAENIDDRKRELKARHDISVRYRPKLAMDDFVFVKRAPNNTENLSKQVAGIPKSKFRPRGLDPYRVTRVTGINAKIDLPRGRKKAPYTEKFSFAESQSPRLVYKVVL